MKSGLTYNSFVFSAITRASWPCKQVNSSFISLVGQFNKVPNFLAIRLGERVKAHGERAVPDIEIARVNKPVIMRFSRVKLSTLISQALVY